jgi:hypothetical protein
MDNNENLDDIEIQDEDIIPEVEENDGSEEIEATSDGFGRDSNSVEEVQKANTYLNKAAYRINDLVRQKNQLLHKLNNLSSENNSLRSGSEVATAIAMEQQKDLLNAKLNEAKLLRIQAEESGDIKDKIDAEEYLTRTVAEITDFDKVHRKYFNSMKEQQERTPQKPKEYEEDNSTGRTSESDREFHSREWLKHNQSWLDNNSPAYNPMLANVANSYAQQMNNYLTQQGRQDLIGSMEYFQQLNQAVNSAAKNQNVNSQSTRGGLNMQSQPNLVHGVNNNYRQGGSNRQQFKLSKDEQELIKNLGITPKTYIINREKVRKENRLKAQQQNGQY